MKIAVLYGGGGYLGHHLAKRLMCEGTRPLVVNLDEERINKVPGVLNLVPAELTYSVYELFTEADTDEIVLYHLACPRNKQGEWNLRLATYALGEGLKLASDIKAEVVYASSLSVFDDPASEYGNFKRVAEVAVKQMNGVVHRLGTLFGATKGLPYRADLGLHIIAETVASGKKGWVNKEIQRYVSHVEYAANAMVQSQSPGHTYATHQGLHAYRNIVPAELPRRMPEKDYYTIPGDVNDPTHFQSEFDRFVDMLKEEHTWPI
jgi:nucleoside-diphosphate-sugar epimerase